MKRVGIFVLGFVFMLAFSGFVVGEEIMIGSGSFGHMHFINFPLKDSTEAFPFLYSNSGVTFDGVGSLDPTGKLVTGDGASITFNDDTDRYFIVSWTDGRDAESYLMRATNFNTVNGIDEVTFQYKRDNSWVNANIDKEEGNTFSLGNVGLKVGAVNSDDNSVVVIKNGVGVSFNTLYSKSGMKFDLPVIAEGEHLTEFVLRATEKDAAGNIGAGKEISMTLSINQDRRGVISVSSGRDRSEIGYSNAYESITDYTKILDYESRHGYNDVTLIYDEAGITGKIKDWSSEINGYSLINFKRRAGCDAGPVISMCSTTYLYYNNSYGNYLTAFLINFEDDYGNMDVHRVMNEVFSGRFSEASGVVDDILHIYSYSGEYGREFVWFPESEYDINMVKIMQLGYNDSLDTDLFVEHFYDKYPVVDIENNCVDSDGGLFPYISGSSSIQGNKYYDKCVIRSDASGGYAEMNNVMYIKSNNDYCEGDDCYVAESYCASENSQDFSVSLCPNGCEDGACIKKEKVPVEQDVNTMTVEINEGWNLVYGFVEPNQIVEGDIVEKDIVATYALIPSLQEYAMIYPDSDEKLNHQTWRQTLSSGMWVYSKGEGEMTYEVYYMTPLSDRKIFAGWNFVGITEDMIGKHKLEDIVGNCDVGRSYLFDSDAQAWEDVSLETVIDDDAIGMTWVVNVAEDCILGAENDVVISAPPILPGLGLSDDIPSERSVDGNDGKFPLEIGGYALLDVREEEGCKNVEDTEVCMTFTRLDYYAHGKRIIVGFFNFLNQVEFNLYKNYIKEFPGIYNGDLPYTYLSDGDDLVWFTENKYELVAIDYGTSLVESNPLIEYFYNKYPAVDVGWFGSENVVVAQVVAEEVEEVVATDKYYGDIKFSRYSGDSELR